MMSYVNMVKLSSLTELRPAAEAAAVVLTDDDDVAVTTPLMTACEAEDGDQVREILAVDEVRINSAYVMLCHRIVLVVSLTGFGTFRA